MSVNNLPDEIWLDIPGYEGLYAVSNMGRVKRLAHQSTHPSLLGDNNVMSLKDMILSPNNNRGYLCVYLTSNSKKHVYRVHNLVAQSFIAEQPSPNHRVIHIDGDKANNHVDNLRWATYTEYTQYNLSNGTFKPMSEETRQRVSQHLRDALMADPERRKRNSDHMKQIWADPQYKAATAQKISDGWKRRRLAKEAELAKLPKPEPYHVPDLPGEEWRDVVGYEGKYSVSNLGRVKSLHRDLPHATHGKWHISERILKPGLTGRPNAAYFSVSLFGDNGKSKLHKVHRLVAEAFIPKIEGKNVINHKDCNKLNNVASNLEWCTDLENTRHAIANNRMDWSKIHRQKVRNVETGQVFPSISAACKAYNVTHRGIYQAANMPNHTCRGCHWQYVE